MANTTASPSGVNRNFAGPSRNTTEVNTQLIARVETMVGTAMPAEPCSVAAARLKPRPRTRWVFSMLIVDEDADRERHAAKRHGVERVAHEVKDDDRCQDRQRDRDQHNQGRAPR